MNHEIYDKAHHPKHTFVHTTLAVFLVFILNFRNQSPFISIALETLIHFGPEMRLYLAARALSA